MDNDKLGLIKENIRYQDEQLNKLELGIDKLQVHSVDIKNELDNQNKMINNLESEIIDKNTQVKNLSNKIKKLYEKKSCWILTIGILIPLLIILILACIYS